MIACWTLSIFDIPAGNGGATYIAGALSLLANTAILFFLVVYSILKPFSPDTGQSGAGAAPNPEAPAAATGNSE